MSELGDALALAHDARERLGTLRAQVHRWQHAERWRRALERHRERHGGDALLVWAAERPAAPAAETTSVIRLWLDGQRMRIELDSEAVSGPQRAVTVTDGARCWSYVPGHGAYVTERADTAGGVTPGLGGIDGLLDPLPLLATLRLQARGRTRWEGRPAFRLAGTLRPGMGHRLFGEGFAAWGDRYDLLLDAERGVLLRSAALLNDEPFAVTELREPVFDEPLAAGLFRFTAPPGTPVVPLRPARGEGGGVSRNWLTIEEAARAVDFTVLAPAALPAATEHRVAVVPPVAGPPARPAEVHVFYDFPLRLDLVECAAEAAVPDRHGWARVEREGAVALVRERKARHPAGRRELKLEREGTLVRMSSDLPLDDLLVVAASLAPVPGP
jgi:hypothetical protein